jgi:glycolate oxidase
MMDRIVVEACERFMSLGLPTDAEALLLVEVDGGVEEAEEALARVRALLAASGASEIRVAADSAEREKLWRSRKGAFAALATIMPDYYTIDGTIPRRCLPEVLEYVQALSAEYGLTVGNVFHAGDGNIHPCIFYDAMKPGELERSEELGRASSSAASRWAARSPGSTASGSRS